MAKVSTKRKSVTEAPERSIFDDFSAMGGTDDQRNEPEKKDEVSLEDVMKQLNDLNARYTDLERTNLALMQQAPMSTQPAAVRQEQKFDTKALGDPTVDPDGYGIRLREAITTDIKNLLENRDSEKTKVQSQEDRVKELWNDFSDKYEDYAEDQSLVEFAATRVARAQQARGVDVQKYMFTSRDKFFKDVVEEMDKNFKIKKDEDTEADEPASRTTGIFGGHESGNRPATRKGEDDPGDMVAEIHAMQRKGGWY